MLQAIAAVDGPKPWSVRTVQTFGSPAVNGTGAGITKYEHGFTWDPVTFLAGFDSTWTISKVGMPSGSMNPITHAFLEYMKRDPAFVVNRFRWGGLESPSTWTKTDLPRLSLDMGTEYASRVGDLRTPEREA